MPHSNNLVYFRLLISYWSSPKPTPLLAAFHSSSLLSMTGTNCKNGWIWRLISPSLTLSISYLRSLPIAAAVHSPSVNSPSNLPTSSPYCLYLLCFSFCTPVSLLTHHHLLITICSLITRVNLLNCNYFAIMAYLLPTSSCHLHTLYIDILFLYCVIDCTLVYSMCNCVVVCVALLSFILARSQL